MVNLQIEFCHWPVRDILIHMKLNAWQNHSYEIVSSTSTVTGQLDGYLDENPGLQAEFPSTADGLGFHPSCSFWRLVKFKTQKKPNPIIISSCQEGIISVPSYRRKSALSSSNQFHICEAFQQNTFCLWFVFILGHTDFRPSVDCNV